MRILFYGAKGWIGSLIKEQWAKVYPEDEIIVSDLHIFPITLEHVEEEIKNLKPGRIISTVGRTYGFDEKTNTFINNIDYLENHLQANVNDNLYSPLLLAKLCEKYSIHLTYLGTGCIFCRDTQNDKYEYTEDSVPDFFGSSYSIVKGYTDQLIKHFSNVANIRIRMPIVPDDNPRNFITKILSYSKISSMPNSMSYLPDIIPIFIDISRNSKSGTFHLTNPGYISHEEILEMYKQRHPEHSYELVDQNTVDGLLKSRRSNNILSTERLTTEYKIRHIRDAVQEAINNF